MDAVNLTHKILKQLFHFLSGFEAQAGLVPVNMELLRRWHDTFVNKVKNGGVAFLRGLE